MELTWYGRTCIRLRGRDAVVVADPYQTVVGPTGRGITGEIVTYSHPDDKPLPKAKGRLSRDGKTVLPSSLEQAFVLDGPGEYEVRDVLLRGVRTYRDDGCVVVEIGDNGPGISREVKPHIFEPFFTTKAVGEGTGLGLDTVQRIVKKHRGNIEVSSQPGDTRFQVWLPLAEAST